MIMRRFASCHVLVGRVLLALLAAYVGLISLRVLYPIAYTSQLIRRAEEHALDPALVAAVIR